jgi:Na+-translocating ferredoxin:NAD+ oxidoreductase RnfC subunit
MEASAALDQQTPTIADSTAQEKENQPVMEQSSADSHPTATPFSNGTTISKNQLKRQRREEHWHATKQERKQKNKEKQRLKKELQRQQKEQEGGDEQPAKRQKPVVNDAMQPRGTILIDASFDALMTMPVCSNMNLLLNCQSSPIIHSPLNIRKSNRWLNKSRAVIMRTGHATGPSTCTSSWILKQKP